MAPQELTDYERRRLDNIRRNSEVLAALNLPQLSHSLKRRRPSNSPKLKPKPQPQPQTPVRRSLRSRGAAPSSPPSPTAPPSPLPPRKRGPLRIAEALLDRPVDSDRHLLVQLLAAASAQPPPPDAANVGARFDPRTSLSLRPQNVMKVVADRILSVRFFPFADRTVVVAGNKLGHVGIWDVDSWDEDSVYLYSPHSAPVSAVSISPVSAAKMYTGSYDGSVRLMDVENETFNMIYSSENLVFSISQWPQEINSLYIGEGAGLLKVWDERAGKASNTWFLHEDRVNTIDFNPQNPNVMATSSTDRTACIWDLRKMNKEKPISLRIVKHHKAVHSAFFSPSGRSIATTSIDDSVGLVSGADFDDLHMIKHNNHTGRWLSSFRAIWGWDDSYLYMGNMQRAIDIISTDDRTTTAIESAHMTSIPCRMAAHQFKEGCIAGAASGGKVYLWTKS